MDKLYTPTEEDHKKWNDCDDDAKDTLQNGEYTRFVSTRSDLLKAESESEKNFDTILLTVSSVAIAASFPIMKDVIKGSNGWLVASWALLGICLVGSLVDRLYTYTFHKNWRLSLDDVFRNYKLHCGHAWKEADARINAMKVKKIWGLFPAEKFMDRIKWVNSGGLVLGLLALMVYVSGGAAQSSPTTTTTTTTTPSSVTFNVYNAPTQPTTLKPSP